MFDIQMGIERPEKEPKTIAEMRQAIEHAGHHSSIIRGSLDAGRYEGLSGEDTYTLLAYRALVALEDYYRRCMHFYNITPSPGVVKLGKVV